MKQAFTYFEQTLEQFRNWGYELSSVRFICGTQEIHKKLKGSIFSFLEMEDAILYRYLKFEPDTTPPEITSVMGPSNGIYTTGYSLNFIVDFNENVTVSGTPYIGLTIGSQSRTASYQSGSGTRSIWFSYTIQADDVDLDGIACANTITLDGGNIQDTVGNNAILTFSLFDISVIFVNAIPPSIIAQPTNQTVNEGQTATFSVTASSTSPLSYQWQVDSTSAGFADIPPATSSSYTTSATTYAMNGSLYRFG